jgi:spoIIIJ-associated protein
MKHELVQNNISELLEKFGFSASDVAVHFDETANTLWFAVTSPHTRLLFNRDAEGLIALNHIATKLSEQLIPERENRLRVVIDANGFEKRKIENLRTTAHMMAERARYFKSSVALDPMLAHERRIVHEFLAAMPDLATESDGVGDKRHVVIKYVGIV